MTTKATTVPWAKGTRPGLPKARPDGNVKVDAGAAIVAVMSGDRPRNANGSRPQCGPATRVSVTRGDTAGSVAHVVGNDRTTWDRGTLGKQDPYQTLPAGDRRAATVAWATAGALCRVWDTSNGRAMVGRIVRVTCDTPDAPPTRKLGYTVTVETYRTDDQGVTYACGSRTLECTPALVKSGRYSVKPA